MCATVANYAAFIDRKRALSSEDFFPDPRQHDDQNVDSQVRFLTGILGCGPDKPGTVN